jgi:glycosyltransferase involved in cell wall biosynthesis
MATIALDATYAIDRLPSGMTAYSRQLIEAFAGLNSDHHFLLCYRLSRWPKRPTWVAPAMPRGSRGPRFSVSYYQQGLTFWLPWQADLFHSLAQRPPAFRFRREVVTIHDVFPLTGLNYSTAEFRRKFGRLLIESTRRAARILVPSEYTRQQLMRHADVDAAKIRVIPYGVAMPTSRRPVEDIAAERQRLGQNSMLVLSVGVLQTRKNIVNALRALQLLPARYRMVFAGGEGFGCEAIYNFIRQHALSDRVTLLGHVEAHRLGLLYQSADVFLFPSLEEGFGLPVLEAMSYGLPVVVANTSSLPEVAGEAALYANPLDARDIADKVQQAAEDHSLRHKLIAASLERASQFTWKLTAQATLDLYEEVLTLRV